MIGIKVVKMKKIALSLLFGITLFADTFTDKSTALMWQDNIDAKTIKKDWQGAISYCQNLNLAGYSDWRLPKRLELLSITDKSKCDPAIKSGFINIASGYYWSSSANIYTPTNAYFVDFFGGSTGTRPETISDFVRCVRDNKK